ncbi:PTS sugar transporter subunit IIA [Victivallis vadensis]|jgi:putative PTS IIA-like nitrogen-regulatory protein ptsN|uniref:PTS sugar transporter subunit IIA n=1 Tax=Victivallis vadensis TaxID=172901 RepID=UPI00266D9331|nr:PTS sugar transporter subunit IIA [Victivallis vadensis]
MNLNEYPVSVSFLPDLEIRDEDDLFLTLAKAAVKDEYAKKCGISPTEIFKQVKIREEQSPTAVGNGLILPHIRLPGLESPVVVLAKLAKTFDCPTPDDRPLTMACLLLVPEENPVEGLRFMADLGSCLRAGDKARRLSGAREAEEVRKLLAEVRKATHTLIAADIMVPCRVFATPKMELKEATRLMAENRQEVIPVLDGRKLVGELSSSELFKLGIPDFFSQLKSVGFIRYFDPFEKYFSVEAASHVEDVMNRELPLFPQEATLIEIVFAISVQHQAVVYVVDRDNGLLGVITQAQLLERIINL